MEKPLQVQALQFEWAWQHPDKSKAARPIAKQLGRSKMTGVKGKVGMSATSSHQHSTVLSLLPKMGIRGACHV